MKSIKITLLFLVFAFKGFSQTQYYVSPTGNNTNDGLTITTPWKTIQKAANSAVPNSVVNITAGTYNELVSINVTGTLDNPIVFKNYQNDVVTVSGAGFTGKYKNIIAINSKSNITIEGLILENLICAYANGVLIVSNVGLPVENITLRNLKVRNIGFTTVATQKPTARNNAHGIEIYGQGITETDAIKNILVENCQISNCILGYSEALTINGNVDGYAILNNAVYDNTNIGIDAAGNFGASANPVLDHARNRVIAANTVYNNISKVANSTGIYCDGCQNTTIEKNNVYLNTVGIAVGCEVNGSSDEVVVRNNMVHQNTYTGIEVGGYTTETTGIVNNTIVKNNSCYFNDTSNLHGQMVIAKVNNCQFLNNILYSNGNLLFYVDKIAPQNFTSYNNLVYTTTAATEAPKVNNQYNVVLFSAYQTSTGRDLNAILADPLFIDTNLNTLNLHLQETSPAINAGSNLFINLTEQDYDGELRYNANPDLGADEFYATLLTSKIKAQKTLTLIPNQDSNTVRVDLKEEGTSLIEIYNVSGKLIKKLTVKNGTQIDLTDFSKGIYFAISENGNQVKFVK